MDPSTISAAVLSLETTKKPAKSSNPRQILSHEVSHLEVEERDARKIRRLETQIQGYQKFLGAIAAVEQPSNKGLQGFIDPRWVHGLSIPNMLHKHRLRDNLVIVFDPTERDFAVLNRVLLHANDYDEIDLPYYNFPLDIITVFGANTYGPNNESKWTLMAKARSKPYKRGEKSGAREQLVTFPLAALGGAVILQRLLHKISKLHILKAKPSQFGTEAHEWHHSTQASEPSHQESTNNTHSKGDNLALHYVALRLMKDVFLKNEITELPQSGADLDTITIQALERIRHARLKTPQVGESQAKPLIKLNYEAAQVLAELVASEEEVKDAAQNLLNTASEHETRILQSALQRNERLPSISSSIATELQYAARRGMVAVVEYLSTAVGDEDHSFRSAINQRNDHGYTPLSLAASEGHVEVVKTLLKHDPDLDLRDNYGQTALSLAARNGHLDIVEVLVEHTSEDDSNLPIRINSQDDSGLTPLSWAARGNSRLSGSIIKALLQAGARPDDGDRTGRSPLSWAAQMGNEAAVRELLRGGASPDTPSEVNNRTPLWWAAGSGHSEIVRLLFELGAGADSEDKFGRTPLSWAAAYGHMDVVNLLLGWKVIVDSKDKDGRTPMSWAAEAGHLEVVAKLIERGANPNSLSFPQDTSLLGRPPLSFAAEKGHLDVVEELIAHGADVNPPYGQPVPKIAEEATSPTLRSTLVSFPRTMSTRAPLSWAAGNGYADMVKLLLRYQSDPNGADEFGRTALWYAARQGHGPVIGLLLAMNADPRIKDLKGSSALDQGYLMEHISVVKEFEDEEARRFTITNASRGGLLKLALRCKLRRLSYTITLGD